MMKKSVLLILSCLIGELIYANDYLNFRNIDVKSGISDNYVLSVLRDRYGFMWFATLNGLDCYDGYRFKKYELDSFGAYNTLYEDAAGNIWVKDFAAYYVYNRELDRLENDIQPVLKKYGIEGKVSFLTVDRNYNLWCANSDTLFHYDFSARKRQVFPLSYGKEVVQVASGTASTFVLFSDGLIVRINAGSRNMQPETQKTLLPGLQYNLYMDTTGRLWLYALHASGLQCYDTNQGQWVDYISLRDLSNALITTVLDDGEGNLWIGTDNKGVYIRSKEDCRLISVNKKSDNPFSLFDNHINCFFKDNQNIMWVGTAKLGVYYTSLDRITFKTCPLPGQEDVKCLQEDEEGNLWIGFDGEGLARQNAEQGTYTYYKKKEHSIPSDLIICSYLDSQDRLWFGTYGGGAFYKQGERFIPLSYPDFVGKDISLSQICRIVEDRNGTIWFATFMQGLYAMDVHGNMASYTTDSSILQTGSIIDLAYSGGRNLYVGTSNGLYVIDIFTRKLTLLNGNKAGTQTLPDSYITCLFYDSRGLLWIGTHKGIVVWDELKDEMVQLTTENGLSHNCVRAIIEDKYKNIWVSSDHGITNIAVAPPTPNQYLQLLCYPYFEEDGISSMTFNLHAITCNRKGEILMGGIGGYLRIDPNPTDFYHYTAHSVAFTGLVLDNQEVEVGSYTTDGRMLLQKNILLQDEITMDYSDNNFALEISSMDFLNLHKQQFAYRLGETGKWIKLDGNRIYFNRLPVGTSSLQVKVYEPDNYHNNPVSTLTIHVRPPFWLSLPAYCCYALLVIACFVLTIRNIQRKHRRLMEKQRYEMEITRQHETDEAKMRFFTNISHDLRTPLALIITPLEKLLSLKLADNLKDELELIHRNAVTLLNEVNQLLDFRKLDKQQVQISLSYGNLSDFVKEVCASFAELFLKSGINLEINVIDVGIDMYFDKNKMQRVLLNLLSNAVKYNKENGKVWVNVRKLQTSQGEQACIQVADTGIGIKDENKEKVFDRFFQEQHSTTYVGSGIGLHIVKEYITLHRGTIRVVDNQPEGSIFVIMLPIVKKNNEAIIAKEAENAFEETDRILVDEEMGDLHTSILVVEDNDDFRHFLTRCLKEHFKVFEASNGQDALDVLARKSVQLVISDVMMPVMDGLELCHAIKTDIRFSHIPIILLSARTAEEHILGGLKEGADEYITKPFNLEILLMRIQKLLKWTQNNHEKFRTIEVSPSEITVSSLDEQLLGKAIQIVEENMDNSEFSVEDLSAQVGISRSGLYKKLISITGKAPLEFMRILRLKRGKQLLEKSQLSISQIAYQVGLSPKQFARYFKEEFGCLPSKYGKKNNK